MRYAGDPKCPPERIQTLAETFGEKLALIELESGGHSTLASDYDGQAFADAVTYLQVALMRMSGPSSMRLAKVGGRPCDITSDGRWRVTP
jgi:hypothetical protein